MVKNLDEKDFYDEIWIKNPHFNSNKSINRIYTKPNMFEKKIYCTYSIYYLFIDLLYLYNRNINTIFIPFTVMFLFI